MGWEGFVDRCRPPETSRDLEERKWVVKTRTTRGGDTTGRVRDFVSRLRETPEDVGVMGRGEGSTRVGVLDGYGVGSMKIT